MAVKQTIFCPLGKVRIGRRKVQPADLLCKAKLAVKKEWFGETYLADLMGLSCLIPFCKWRNCGSR